MNLRALREIGFLPEIIEFEERGASFALGLHHGRRRDFAVAVVEVMIAKRLRHDASHLENLGRIFAAKHDVTVVQLNVDVSFLVQEIVRAPCALTNRRDLANQRFNVIILRKKTTGK